MLQVLPKVAQFERVEEISSLKVLPTRRNKLFIIIAHTQCTRECLHSLTPVRTWKLIFV